MKLFQIQRLQDGAWEYEHECTYKRNTEERSGKYGCRGKAVSITYPECVCSLAYPVCNAHAHIILSSFACLALPYFSTLSDKRQDFRKKKVLEPTTYNFTFSTTFTHQFNGTHPLCIIHHIDTVVILMFLLKHYVFRWKISGVLYRTLNTMVLWFYLRDLLNITTCMLQKIF